MLDALSITWRGAKNLWDEFALLIGLNLLWTLCLLLAAVPFYGLQSVGFLWAVLLTLLILLPLPVISAGLCFVANQITHGIAVGWGTFVSGVRRYWSKGLIVGLVNGVILFLIGTNIRFYLVVVQGTLANFALSAWVVVALYWLLAQIYWFPMLLEMEDENLLRALRNALVMVIVTPGFSIVLGLIFGLLIAVSLLLTVPAALFLAALLLLISNHARRSRIARVRKKPYDPEGEEG
jgi:hypothetical protein